MTTTIEEEKDVCEFCGGEDGEHHEVSAPGYVYAGEPHMADIETQPCPASVEVEEDV